MDVGGVMRFKVHELSAVLALLLPLCGCAGGIETGASGSATLAAPQSTSPSPSRSDHFAATATVKDDALETSAVYSTEKGHQEKRGLLGLVPEDQFLRCFHDKRTGKRRYQVYVTLAYKSDTWREPFQANFGTPLQTAPTKSALRQSDCKDRRKIGGCVRIEHVVFEVPEAEFRRIAEAAPADIEAKTWDFRLKTKDGKDYADQLPYAEFAGLARAMAAHKPVAMR